MKPITSKTSLLINARWYIYHGFSIFFSINAKKWRFEELFPEYFKKYNNKIMFQSVSCASRILLVEIFIYLCVFSNKIIYLIIDKCILREPFEN